MLKEGTMPDLDIDIQNAGGTSEWIKSTEQRVNVLYQRIRKLKIELQRAVLSKSPTKDIDKSLQATIREWDELTTKLELVINSEEEYSMKKKPINEAIEEIGIVNNLNNTEFDEKSLGVAPVSYADAVLRSRKKEQEVVKNYRAHLKLAQENLKKEISNEEHPEPLDKINPVEESNKLTLSESLFEALEEGDVIKTTKDDFTKPDILLPKAKQELGTAIMELLEGGFLYYTSPTSSADTKGVYSSCGLTKEDDIFVWVDGNGDEAPAQRVADIFGLETSIQQVAGVRGKSKKFIIHIPNFEDTFLCKDYEEGLKSWVRDHRSARKKAVNESLEEAKVKVELVDGYIPSEGARAAWDRIEEEGKFSEFESLIEEMWPEGVDESELDEMLTEQDWVYSMLRISDEEPVEESLTGDIAEDRYEYIEALVLAANHIYGAAVYIEDGMIGTDKDAQYAVTYETLTDEEVKDLYDEVRTYVINSLNDYDGYEWEESNSSKRLLKKILGLFNIKMSYN